MNEILQFHSVKIDSEVIVLVLKFKTGKNLVVTCFENHRLGVVFLMFYICRPKTVSTL